MEEKKGYKTFKDYYADPEFRARHIKYMSEKVPCECGFVTRRSYMTRHRRTAKHKRLMNRKDPSEFLG